MYWIIEVCIRRYTHAFDNRGLCSKNYTCIWWYKFMLQEIHMYLIIEVCVTSNTDVFDNRSLCNKKYTCIG